jgi:imidazole glycerol-phosphate synthase subunit HisH
MMIIVDYGRGNLWSVQKGFARVGAEAQVSGDPDVVAKADAVVFPGVGAFRDCMQNLSATGLDEALRQVIVKGRPVLAICVGMQALLAESEEFGRTSGFAILKGRVQRFATASAVDVRPLKVPHMGWNQLHMQRDCPLLKGIPNGVYTYFVHSYYAVPEDPHIVVAQTDYGTSFASVLWRDNLYATQFHPEKSQTYGLHILQNFVTLSRGASGSR